jgi:hypothetical protein
MKEIHNEEIRDMYSSLHVKSKRIQWTGTCSMHGREMHSGFRETPELDHLEDRGVVEYRSEINSTGVD